MTEDITIEWVQRSTSSAEAMVHLCRTVLQGTKLVQTYKTLLLRNGSFNVLPRDWTAKTLPKRWSQEQLKEAALRATSFIEKNHDCYLTGQRLLLNPPKQSLNVLHILAKAGL